jgi:hypothetical protein
MNTPIKPWSIYRQVLWLMGALGLLLLWFGFLVAVMLQGGFGPGSHTSPPSLADLVAVTMCSVLGAYYIVVAHRRWTRRLWRVGLAVHGLVVVYLIINGAFFGILLVLIWAAAWSIYAQRNTFEKTSA